MKIETLDLEYRDTPTSIAAFLVFADSPVLVETGPASTLSNLDRRLAEHGVSPDDVRHVFVTHIHLDHAGAAGYWAQRGAQVYVHPRGASHLVDPSKLLASAARIYGDQMDALWGVTVAAPAERVTPVADGETIAVAGLEIVALETPGHARHHHVYRLGEVAFTGDAAGILVPGLPLLELPAPPPEFDLESWKATIARLEAERLRTLYRTHFGPSDDVGVELEALKSLLDESVAFVAGCESAGLDRPAIIERYLAWVRERGRSAGAGGDTLRTLSIANPREMSVDGILRYLAKRSRVA